MIKDIKYSGIALNNSGYDAPDGTLDIALNLINDAGALEPIPQPVSEFTLADGERLVALHTVNNSSFYITLRPVEDGDDEVHALYALPSGAAASSPLQEAPRTSHLAPAFITYVHGFRSIAVFGATLVIATAAGMLYVIYKNDAYVPLGTRPPFISISFGLKLQGTLDAAETFSDVPTSIIDDHPTGINGKRPAKEELTDITQRVFAQLLAAVADRVTANGCFYQPFFVRYACRLFDGSYAYHSAPVLLIPAVTVPRIDITSSSGGNVTSKLAVPFFELRHKIDCNDIENFKKWSDIITAIDIFVSAPIYTFDQSKDFSHPTTTLAQIYRQSTALAASGSNNAIRGRSAEASSYFNGRYADTAENSPYTDHIISDPDSKTICWNIPPHERFIENIRSAHEFYKIAEIDIEDLAATDGMQPLKLTTSDLSTLVTRPSLPDDYISHATLRPDILFPFNARLNIAGVVFAPPVPLPVPASVAFANPDSANFGYSITVWSRHNGLICRAVYSSDGATDVFNIAAGSPRYIFYPDANAFRMEIEAGTTKYTIPLKPHDFLNGAYYFAGTLIDTTPPSSLPPAPSSYVDSVAMPSKIYTSQVENPFTFPPQSITTVGSGSVIALSAAAKALSQGQFGQFPLYAFTTEGVWALQNNESGAYIAVQPLSRDVCSNPQAVTQIDSAVLFPTDRGIMLLAGSQTQCISDPINTDTPFDLNTLPNLPTSSIPNLLTSYQPNSLSAFLAGSGMIYDYVNQHIIIFNTNRNYAYVYSLKTHLWGMMHSNIAYSVKSYPRALAVVNTSTVVNFSEALSGSSASSPMQKCPSACPPNLLITRPLKLDAPDIFKTIDTVIQRGHFAKGHVQSLLYASRDLFSWHLVWSSKDHTLRGFRGSPYKYFRIALICSLAPGESISGATVQFTPRLTNRPR